jgi:hypothetical protein
MLCDIVSLAHIQLLSYTLSCDSGIVNLLHINQAEIANQTSYIHGNESEGPDGPTI